MPKPELMFKDNTALRSSMFFQSLTLETQKRLIRRIEEVNHDIRTRGISRSDSTHSAIAGIQDLMTGYSYGEFYDWDLYYEF